MWESSITVGYGVGAVLPPFGCSNPDHFSCEERASKGGLEMPFKFLRVPTSDDAEDKRVACMNWSGSAVQGLDPHYAHACTQWYQSLTRHQRSIARKVINYHNRPELLPSLLADLPSAPKFPDRAFERWTQEVTFGYPLRSR